MTVPSAATQKKRYCSKMLLHMISGWLATLPCHLPLITMHASYFRQFSDIDLSQGSAVIRLRCGEIINHNSVAYSLMNLLLLVNKF